MPSGRIRFKPKVGKIVETILYLAHKGLDLDQYKAVKLIYLADREHLNRFGRPITFDTMVAMEFGPVASVTYNILKGGKVAGLDRTALPFSLKAIGQMIYVEQPTRAVNRRLFSKSDLMVIDGVVAAHGAAAFRELYELTHAYFDYTQAWARRGGGKAAAIFFEDMIDESEAKEDIVEDLAFAGPRM